MTRLTGQGVLLRPGRISDVPRQRSFFENRELALLDPTSPEAYARTDVQALLLEPSGDQLRLAIEVDGEYIGFAKPSCRATHAWT